MVLQAITLVLAIYGIVQVLLIRKQLSGIIHTVDEYLDSVVDSEDEIHKEKVSEEKNIIISRVLEEIFP